MKYYSEVLFLLILSRYGRANDRKFSEKQYASIPDIFHYDNFDKCMLHGDEAFYCSLQYELEPLDKDNPSEMWRTIKNISDVTTNYRHDHLRHFICATTACPEVKQSKDDDPLLKEELKQCFDRKFAPLGLNGTVTKVSCETAKSKYPVDYLDIFAGLLFISYVLFVFYASIYEGVARYGPQEDYAKLGESTMGKVILSCAIARNWIRLKTINHTPEVEKLRWIQGLRFYTTVIVVLTHTCLSYLAVPVANTRYVETMHEKVAALFLASGPLCVATFFYMSSFLLANSLFDYLKEKKINLKTISFMIANRFFRLSPTVFVVVLFHATILRHLGRGPNWDALVGSESRSCRTKGWTNVIFLNNVNPYNMCLPVTWSLALDTQYFVISLFLIWLIKSYEKYVYHILGTVLSLNIVATFVHNYYHDFTALEIPTAEKYYLLRHIKESYQFHYQLCSFIGNFAATVIGITFGYYFHKHKNDGGVFFFNSKIREIMWWLIAWGIGLNMVLIPTAIILNENTPRNRFWASVLVAVSRPIFAIALAIGYMGVMDGVGFWTRMALEWRPTYVLGRLTFSAYLIHMSLVLLRPGLARFPPHISDYEVFVSLLGDLGISFLAALLLALFLELPLSELQKVVFGLKKNEEAGDKKEKDK